MVYSEGTGVSLAFNSARLTGSNHSQELAFRSAILYGGLLISNAFGSVSCISLLAICGTRFLQLMAAGILSGMEGKRGIRGWRWCAYSLISEQISEESPPGSSSSRWIAHNWVSGAFSYLLEGCNHNSNRLVVHVSRSSPKLVSELTSPSQVGTSRLCESSFCAVVFKLRGFVACEYLVDFHIRTSSCSGKTC